MARRRATRIHSMVADTLLRGLLLGLVAGIPVAMTGCGTALTALDGVSSSLSAVTTDLVSGTDPIADVSMPGVADSDEPAVSAGDGFSSPWLSGEGFDLPGGSFAASVDVAGVESNLSASLGTQDDASSGDTKTFLDGLDDLPAPGAGGESGGKFQFLGPAWYDDAVLRTAANDPGRSHGFLDPASPLNDDLRDFIEAHGPLDPLGGDPSLIIANVQSRPGDEDDKTTYLMEYAMRTANGDMERAYDTLFQIRNHMYVPGSDEYRNMGWIPGRNAEHFFEQALHVSRNDKLAEGLHTSWAWPWISLGYNGVYKQDWFRNGVNAVTGAFGGDPAFRNPPAAPPSLNGLKYEMLGIGYGFGLKMDEIENGFSNWWSGTNGDIMAPTGK